jgi:histidine transport system substrate-binding protein
MIFGADGPQETISLTAGSLPGFEREMIEGFATLHRLKVEFVAVRSGGERIPALLADKGDVAGGGLIITEARRKLADFTSEVFPTRHVTVTRRPHRLIETLEQLRQARVGTHKGSSWAEAVTAAGVPPENVDDSFESPRAVLQGLREGKVAAVVMALGWALLEQRKDPELELGLFVGPVTSRAWGVQRDAPQLRHALNEYITNFRQSGAWNRLVVKYYGDLALEVLKKARQEP